MGEINVTGLGRVRIQGDFPTPEEEQAIIDAIQGTRPTPEMADPERGLQVTPEGGLRPEDTLTVNPTPFLEDLTGGIVTRGLAEGVGATGGMVVGAASGLLTGPGAPAASPTGAIAGGVLGAGLGSTAFDAADEIARRIKGMGPKDEEFFESSVRAAEAMRMEFLFSGGAASLGPVFKAFKPRLGKVLGVGSDTARRLARTAEGLDIPLGILQASESETVKGVSTVLSVFPFIGTPIKKAAKATTAALEGRMSSILNELAPNATISELGVDLTVAAKGQFKKFRRIASVLYDRFNTLADNASTKEIIPTTETSVTAREFVEQAKAGQITLKTGKPLTSPADDPLNDYLNQLTELPGAITAKQARQFQRELQVIATQMEKDGFDLSRVVSIKKALEVDLNNILVDLLPEDEAVKLVSALANANGFYAETIRRFQTTTAKRFARVDKNIFAPGAFKAGATNADEIFSAIFNSRSPQALADLRSIVGRKEFASATRQFLEGSFKKSLTPTTTRGVSFDVDKFAKSIGLGEKGGERGLAVMLSGSDVRIQDLREFVDVARAAGSIIIPDTSKFVMRRVILAGLKTLATLGVGQSVIDAPVTTTVAVLLLRSGAKILSNPKHLRALTTALKDSVPELQRRSLVLRVARQVLGDEEVEVEDEVEEVGAQGP